MRLLVRLVLLTALLLSGWALADSEQVSITIIIDDLGNNLQDGQRALALPGPVTYAVLPFRPHSIKLAEQAYQQGKEVMLHMPMDNSHDRPLGPGGLTVSLNREHYEQRFHRAIAATPHISGVNNHMGSRLTANSERMQWLMETLKGYPLYFVDSRTSASSVAAITASKNRIPTLERDIFLDHEPNVAFIDKQFKKLIKVARQKGSAVAIGHPYPSTLGYLENVLPRLDAMGIRLVSPSGLIALNSPSATPKALAETLTPTHEPEILLAKTPLLSGNRCRITEFQDVTRVNCS